jgi:triphosphoribosyl-dephospho-CoA synthase
MSEKPATAGLTVEAAATLACIWEATAPKPGNVHPHARFADLEYRHFLQSGIAIGPAVGCVAELGVGRTVLEAVRATRKAVGTNTNLGTLLLIVPLAAVPDGIPAASRIDGVIQQLTAEDTRYVYEAIRTANAGGLGRVAEADVKDDPPPDLKLVDAMRLAADRDLVARQYVNGFADVFTGPVVWIEEGVARKWRLTEAIVHAHLQQLAKTPDSLITRKCGPTIAREASDRAARVLACGTPSDAAYGRAIAEFDAWLRADGHRRNPGTTADLIAAALFVLLREGRIKLKRHPHPHGAFRENEGSN